MKRFFIIALLLTVIAVLAWPTGARDIPEPYRNQLDKTPGRR